MRLLNDIKEPATRTATTLHEQRVVKITDSFNKSIKVAIDEMLAAGVQPYGRKSLTTKRANNIMKTVYIMRGAPGSSKSTCADELMQTFVQVGKSVTIVSADYYFHKDGEYKFNRKLLGEAHGECLRLFIEAVQKEDDVVIVDNTSIDSISVAPYYSVARAYGYQVEVKTFIVSPEDSYNRNQHGVSFKNCKRMCEIVQKHYLPNYWNLTEQKFYPGSLQPNITVRKNFFQKIISFFTRK